MGKIIDLLAGSQEWLDYRRSKITASQSSIILGINPWQTPKDLYEEKINGIKQESNSSMVRGLSREIEGIKWAEKHFGTIFSSRTIEHDEHPWKCATVDGIDPTGKLVIEIKFANGKVHELAKEGKVIDYYYSQVQSQISCCDVEEAWFLSCFQHRDARLQYSDDSWLEFTLVHVKRDQDYIDNMISKEKEWYIKHIVMMEEPELTDADYETIENDQFDQCCSEYLRICKEIAALEKKKKEMHTMALTITNNRSSKSESFKATKFKVKGSVDYSSVDALKHVNLDMYRKEGREQWKISSI